MCRIFFLERLYVSGESYTSMVKRRIFIAVGLAMLAFFSPPPQPKQAQIQPPYGKVKNRKQKMYNVHIRCLILCNSIPMSTFETRYFN